MCDILVLFLADCLKRYQNLRKMLEACLRNIYFVIKLFTTYSVNPKAVYYILDDQDVLHFSNKDKDDTKCE